LNEPAEPATGAEADKPAAPDRRQPRPAIAVIALVALVAALYFARAFFVPLLIGILASYALHPMVDALERLRLPRSIGAALVLLAVVGGLSWIGGSMSSDAESIIEKLPEAARKLRLELSAPRTGAPSALQNMQEAAKELQAAAVAAAATASAQPPAGAKPKERILARVPAPLPATPEPTWLRDYTLAQSALLVTVAAQTPIVLLLTYFLLASGVHFRRKLVQFVGPSLARKKEAVRTLEEIDVQVQRYLLVMLGSNVLVGFGTWATFLALGLDHAGVWGVAAGVLHFIPYLGPAVIAFGSGVAAHLQFGSMGSGLATAALSLLVSGLVGIVLMTWLQSRFARVNAAVLFIALLFFGWLWGVWGLLLGAPILAIAKVVFDRVESLKPVGDLLGQ